LAGGRADDGENEDEDDDDDDADGDEVDDQAVSLGKYYCLSACFSDSLLLF
jgi:hypothetical protein